MLSLQKQFSLMPLSQYGKPVITAKNETLADFKKAVVSPNTQDSIRFFEETTCCSEEEPVTSGRSSSHDSFRPDRLG